VHFKASIYMEDCIVQNKQYYGETQFRRYYHQYAKKKKATIRLNHKPGLAMQVDWAGSKIGNYDEEFSELREAHLFGCECQVKNVQN